MQACTRYISRYCAKYQGYPPMWDLYIPVPCPSLNLCRSPVKFGGNMQVETIDQ